MAHARITIDGKIEMDDNLGDWQARPPEFLKKMVEPASRPDPHIKAVGIVLADSLMTGHDVAIDVVTDTDGSWTMSVSQSLAIALPGPDTTT